MLLLTLARFSGDNQITGVRFDQRGRRPLEYLGPDQSLVSIRGNKIRTLLHHRQIHICDGVFRIGTIKHGLPMDPRGPGKWGARG